MIQVQKTILDAGGVVIARGALPLAFDCEDQAALFMGHFLAASFPPGKSGYDSDGAYWWGRQGDTNSQVHHYTLQY